jgi:predicted RNA methylase
MHDLHAFADPWEHVRLLSDEARNAALLALLQRRAPGRRVLEVGCGTGLLSVVAARLGATEVHAVEPTERADVAAALVAANGLDGVVHVHRAAIEDLDPRPVDLAFSELLNVDPFVEGLLEASRAASAWLVPSGHLAPSRLRLYGALVGDDDSAAEVARVRTLLDRLARDHDLRLDPLQEELAGL